jgi:hypothetical protein
MTTEQYASRIFSRGTLNGGVIEVPGPMDPESARSMAQSFVTAAGEWHMPKVLPMGAKMADPKLALTPENAQMLLSRKFAISDVARWLGLPPHMIGDLDRATFSNIEHQGQEFVTYSLGPWLSLWEFAINDQLILQPNRFFAEFTRDALVRGDIAARWQAYQIAVQTGTWTRNEVRRKENMNALDGLDEPLDPAHLTGSQPPTAQPARQHAAGGPAIEGAGDRAGVRGAAAAQGSHRRAEARGAACGRPGRVRRGDHGVLRPARRARVGDADDGRRRGARILRGAGGAGTRRGLAAGARAVGHRTLRARPRRDRT